MSLRVRAASATLPIALCTALTALCAAPAAAENARWLSPVDGLWHDPSRWTSAPFPPINGVPAGTTYTATIDATGAPHTVRRFGGNYAVDAFILSSPDAILEVTGGVFTVGQVTISSGVCKIGASGALALGGAEVAGSMEMAVVGSGVFPLLILNGPMRLDGRLTMGSSRVQGAAPITVTEQGTIEFLVPLGAGAARIDTPVDVAGAVRVRGAGDFFGPTLLRESARVEISPDSGADYRVSFGNETENKALTTKTGAGRGELRGVGSAGAAERIQSGPISIDEGTLRVGGWTHRGTTAVAAGATLELFGGNVFQPDARVTGPGDVLLRDEVTIGAMTFGPARELRMDGCALTCPEPMSLRTIDVAHGALHLPADLTMTGSFAVEEYAFIHGPGRLVVAPEAELSFDDSEVTLQQGVTLDVQGNARFARTARLYMSWDAAVRSVVDWEINVAPPHLGLLSALSGGGALHNEGVIRKTGAGELTIAGDDGSSTVPYHPQATLVIDGGGLISVEQGALKIIKIDWRSGAIVLAPGTSLSLDGAVLPGAGVTGAGDVRVEGRPFRGGVAITGALTLGGSIESDVSAGVLGPPYLCTLTPGVRAQSAGSFTTQHIGGLTALTFQIAGPECAPDGAPRVIAGGEASLGGLLAVEFVSGFQPHPGLAWTLIEFGSRTASRPDLVLPAFASGDWKWWRELDQSRLRVGIRVAPDLNHDGVVDFLDLNLVLSNFGALATDGWPIPGDANLDRRVDFVDLNLVLDQYGSGLLDVGR